ncbi:transposase IS204/IS1001/IS1096/IS1165 family protein [Sulfobacillus acidophilus TPY]|nr:transposase IS204/IS1001/IS1096/IS1165 family protein [Sulfobacillus acidophilus TPY]
MAQGDNFSAITRALNLDRHTVRKYARMPAPPAPDAPQRRRRPQEDRWAAVFEAAWAAGHHTPTALDAAARTPGYTGSRSTVYRWLVARHGTRRRHSPPRRPAPWRPRRWAMACLRRWTTLPRATTERLSMRLQDPEVRRVWTLVHQFRVMVTHHRERALAAWLCRAETSGIPELARFARGLCADEAAVRAAIREPWNQGRVKGN